MNLNNISLRRLIAGGDCAESAYDSAVADGLIDPKKVSFCEFYRKVEGDYHIDPTRSQEIAGHNREVANLFKR